MAAFQRWRDGIIARPGGGDDARLRRPRQRSAVARKSESWHVSSVRARILFTATAALVLACADLGQYVWVQAYEAPPAERGFVIAPGDVLMVRHYTQESLNTKARVRDDGSITLPLLNDVHAASYTPAALGQQLETRYKEFLKQPVISVSIEEAQPLSIPVAGEVVKPSVVSTDRQTTVLKVLLLAGGLTEFAGRDRIFVVRPGKPSLRIRFNWKSLIRGEPPASVFELRAGDSIVVE
jgi:polysaccharide biosynthesis/export protein